MSKASSTRQYTHCIVCGGKFFQPTRTQLCEDCMEREDQHALDRIREFVRRPGRPSTG